MSFFKKLFGATSFDDERADADRLFDGGHFEDAQLAYQRAIDKKKGAPEEAVAHCKGRLAICFDRIAEARIAEAETLRADGHRDLAQAELRAAIETAQSDAVVKRAQQILDAIEEEDAKENAELPEELSDEDRWAILAGSWSEAQIEEYDEYGDEFRAALLALHDGRIEEARPVLERIVEEHEEPRFALLELGRARGLAEDFEGAESALRRFLASLDDDDAVDARLTVHAELAGLRDRAGDEEGALAELEAAMDAAPDDPRAFFIMGRYLRSKGHDKQAAKVLEAALPLLDEDRPDVRFLEELGLAKLGAGKRAEAASYFDRVLTYFVSIRRLDFPPATALARAQIYEKDGELEKAADLYRGLANGSDRENHLLYHREAGRLLIELDLLDEARRMLTRALALAKDDEARTAIEAEFAKIA